MSDVEDQNVIPLNSSVNENIDLNPNKVLEAAVDHVSDCVVIVAYDLDGEFYFASSSGKPEKVMWMLEQAKKKLLDMVEVL